jgi:hypothetical protein
MSFAPLGPEPSLVLSFTSSRRLISDVALCVMNGGKGISCATKNVRV